MNPTKEAGVLEKSIEIAESVVADLGYRFSNQCNCKSSKYGGTDHCMKCGGKRKLKAADKVKLKQALALVNGSRKLSEVEASLLRYG